MSSFSFGGDSQLPATQPATLGRVNVTTSMIHAAEGGPALFLALGGNAQIQQPLGKTWTFNVKSEMDAAVAIAISFDRFDIKGPSTGNFQFSVGYAANPRKPSPEEPAPPPIAFSFPSSIGCRIDFGHLDFSLSLSFSWLGPVISPSSQVVTLSHGGAPPAQTFCTSSAHESDFLQAGSRAAVSAQHSRIVRIWTSL